MSAAYDLVSLRADAPDRPPHWRWLRAERLTAMDRQPDRRRDDGWVVVAMRFQRQFRDAQNDPDRLDLLAERHPAVFWAHRVCLHPSRTNARAQVEARLLAKDYSADQTSARTGLSLTQLEAYANLFFDVRGRLENLGWMIDCVFGQDLLKGFNPKQNTDLLLKVAGWMYGSLGVDRVSGRVVDGRAAENDETLNEQVDQADGFESRLRSYLATRNLAVNEFTAPVIYQHANDLRRRGDDREKTRGAAGDGGADIAGLRAIVTALAAHQRLVTKNSLTGEDPLTLSINAAAEPRAADLFRLSAGGTGPTVTLAGVKFPEVTADDRK